MKKIVIAGGTGLIGTHLAGLLEANYQLVILTRNPEKYKKTSHISYEYWNGMKIPDGLLNGAYAVINLAGENIGEKRWTKNQKEKILNSRVDASDAITREIKKTGIKHLVWIQASAIGIYRSSDNEITERVAGNGGSDTFLHDVCLKWESGILNLENTEVRKVIIRSGVVLSPSGGFWMRLKALFPLRIIAIPGNGRNFISWIHIDDEVRAIRFLLEEETASGVYNLTAPQPCRMNDWAEAIRKPGRNFAIMHIPSFLLKWVFGKSMVDDLIAVSQYVIPERLTNSGFVFKYQRVDDAVGTLLN